MTVEFLRHGDMTLVAHSQKTQRRRSHLQGNRVTKAHNGSAGDHAI